MLTATNCPFDEVTAAKIGSVSADIRHMVESRSTSGWGMEPELMAPSDVTVMIDLGKSPQPTI
jgi:hypothetical protein